MLAKCLKNKWSLLLTLLYVPFFNYPEMDHLSSFFAFDVLFCVQIHAPFSILTVHSFLWTCNYKLWISVECFWLPRTLQWFPPTLISICFTFPLTPCINVQLLWSRIYQHFCLCVLVLALSFALLWPPKIIKIFTHAFLRWKRTGDLSPAQTLPSHPHSDGNSRPTRGSSCQCTGGIRAKTDRKARQKGMTFLTTYPHPWEEAVRMSTAR